MNSFLVHLAGKIKETGFSCRSCGACCREEEPDGNLVMVTPPEIHAIEQGAGVPFGEIAEPYPGVVAGPDGTCYTFEWALKRDGDRCRFLAGTRCRVYPCRPWICRTYPFCLDGERLEVHPCPGIGSPIGDAESLAIARALVARRDAEKAEEAAIAKILAARDIPPGDFVVIDSEGARPWP